MTGQTDRKARRRVTSEDVQAWKYFLGYYRPSAGALLGYTLVAGLQSALIVPVFYLVRFAFDVAIPKADIRLLIYSGLGIVLVRLISGILMLSSRRLIVGLIKTAITRLRNDLVVKLYSLSRDFHNRADLNQLHTRLVQDSERMDNVSNTLFSSIVPATLASVTILAALFMMDWRLSLMMIAIAPMVWLALRITNRGIRRKVHIFQRAFEDFSNGILFVLRQMDLTRFLAREEGEIVRQNRNAHRLKVAGESMAMSFASHRMVQQQLTGLAGAIILVAGGAEVARGLMTIGGLLAFYVAAGLLNGSVNTALGGVADLIAGSESLAALHGLIKAGPAHPYTGTRKVELDGRIALEHVVFGYGDHRVLDGITLTLNGGARVALVGKNGAGKTTVLNLIVGLERPKAGMLRAGGVPYDEIDMANLRRQIGIVPQAATFFSGTIRENITYGKPEASHDELVAAAKLASAHDFISRLADGYDTEIGESGHLLSGGECQRIAIARALLARPKLLILDEPTNHLDSETIQRLNRNLAELDYRPAVLMISHDPRVTELADEIYSLQDGILMPLHAPQSIIATAR